jgi:hypothetical protein
LHGRISIATADLKIRGATAVPTWSSSTSMATSTSCTGSCGPMCTARCS